MSDDATSPPASFQPATLRTRRDGWTPERQAAFIAALAEHGSVTKACHAVGIGRKSAYRLREHPAAADFRTSWSRALAERSREAPADFSRALHGVPVRHFYQGRQIGEHRRFDNRLTMFLLQRHDPARFGAADQDPSRKTFPR